MPRSSARPATSGSTTDASDMTSDLSKIIEDARRSAADVRCAAEKLMDYRREIKRRDEDIRQLRRGEHHTQGPDEERAGREDREVAGRRRKPRYAGGLQP